MGFSKGDLVVNPTDPSKTSVIIGGPRQVGGTDFYVVLLADEEQAIYPASELVARASDPDNPVSWLTDRPLLDPHSFARSITQLKLTAGLTDMVYSLSSSRTAFRVHQFKPVLKVIDSPVHRLLLADEVGLGKTIEAGLVWTELDARTPMRRVLVVCPSGLRRKWQIEMERRFDREMQIVDRAGFLEFVDRYEERGDVTRFFAISSFPQLRHDSVIDALSQRPPAFDLVIVDEAHALRNTQTKTHHLGELLAQCSDGLLFLSATPVNLGSNDLFNLLRLLRPDEFNDPTLFRFQLEPNEWINAAASVLRSGSPPDWDRALELLRTVEQTSQAARFARDPRYRAVVKQLEARSEDRAVVVELQAEIADLNTLAHVYTRTRKRDLPDQPAVRRARHLEVELTATERVVHDLTLELVSSLKRQTSGAAPSLAAVMPARQASSCLPAMRAYLADLRERGRIVVDLSEGEEDDEETFSAVDTNDLAVDDDLIRTLGDLDGIWDQMEGVDSKYDVLAEALSDLRAEGSHKALLFAYFRGTLAHLHDRLTRDGYTCLLLHGGVPQRDRDSIIQRFRHEDIDVLLCSEVGSEGLDFEFCDVVVNYDLPWNPMRLEQRIGRIDRYGQKSPVIHVINFKVPGTIDTEIFWRLYDRLGVFERSIGELEPILGEQFREVNRAMASRELTFDEQQTVVEDIAQAIEREQQQLEQFEEVRDRLVGSDAFIEQSLGEAYRSKRYVTADELARYVEGFVREHAGPARLDPPVNGGHGYSLVGSPTLADLLRSHGAGHLTPSFTSILNTLEAGGTLVCTFDPETAGTTDADFITLRHPLVRTMADVLGDEDHRLHRAGFVELDDERFTGEWIFFVVTLTASGLLPKKSILVVACERGMDVVNEQVGDAVLTHLAGAEPARLQQQHIPIVESREVEAAYGAVLDSIAARREQLQLRLQDRNDAIISAQQESLRLSLDVRTARVQEMADLPGINERIRRMRLAQITNLQQSVRAQIEQLEGKREVTVGFAVVAGGLARFRHKASP